MYNVIVIVVIGDISLCVTNRYIIISTQLCTQERMDTDLCIAPPTIPSTLQTSSLYLLSIHRCAEWEWVGNWWNGCDVDSIRNVDWLVMWLAGQLISQSADQLIN